MRRHAVSAEGKIKMGFLLWRKIVLKLCSANVRNEKDHAENDN
jgi:hypothetical protein